MGEGNQRHRDRHPQWLICALSILFCLVGNGVPALASSLRIFMSTPAAVIDRVEADYGMAHVFLDEVAHEEVPITVFFDPQRLGVEAAEVFTNLNRRERATKDTDHDGIEDGIKPPSGNSILPGDDGHYFKAYSMHAIEGGYELTLKVSKTGAYRLTARYRLNGDPAGTYRWYGDEPNGEGIRKRDFAIVVSPSKARNLQLYEVNPLTMVATGTAPHQRGTFADLADGPPSMHGAGFSLSYMKHLGANMIWFQPIHPRGIEGRQIDPTTQQPYELGSPYAVKNFFAVMPLMAKGVTPSELPDTAEGRVKAMTEFQHFAQRADAQGVDLMLDAPFNHTAHDVELSSFGKGYWGGAGTVDTTEIRSIEARVFSRAGAYDMRAHDAASLGIAPDRSDFGKWSDVSDIYFGRYAALVANDGQREQYKNEADWFDYSVGTENQRGEGHGHFDSITHNVWRYFGDYLEFWLTQSGYPANSSRASLDSSAGVDALRADFGQGLPPQCWEYIINRTRSRKWNFVFMAESLDGGPVSYRSARHFDVLNENIVYDLHRATTMSAIRQIYEGRTQSYGGTPVLLNTSSHDEDSYKDPFEALLRFATNSTRASVTMIFPGQELGLRGTIVPPNGSDAQLQPFGYDRYDKPFFGKPIPGFKTFNSLMPLWEGLKDIHSEATRLKDLYSSIGRARQSSSALRSANRVYLNSHNGAPQEQIFRVAKFERRNADPAVSDVVFAFVNLKVSADAETPLGSWFNVNVDVDSDGMNDFGIKPDRRYNVKNIAAYTGIDVHRHEAWLWGTGRSGKDLLKEGIYVHLNRVPENKDGWVDAPYEAQYLKLIDVTP
jgi:hypothetical protein